MQPSSPLTYARAKRMRHEPTDGERKLWGALRNRALAGYKFYRQVPVGPFIVDFINHQHGVVIEVDGATHGGDAAIAHDVRRTDYLRQHGLIVHRIDNVDLFRNLGGVLDGICAVMAERASEGTSPAIACRDGPPSPVARGR